ncbi:MAG: hypothetical protein AB7V27_14530 [Candidatus Binatia bacterium]
MPAALADLQRVGVKLFCADGTAVAPHELVPVFHHWIQRSALPDHRLVDIADYAHVPAGPGVLVVAHEANLAVDMGDGRIGLQYTRKQPAPGALAERLRTTVKSALRACRLLEQNGELGAGLRFRGDELDLFANDRLRAPNEAATYEAFKPTLEELLRALYGDAACEIAQPSDPRSRFGFHIKAAASPSIADLLSRLD